MYLRLAKRLLLETDKRLLWKLAWNMGFKGMLSVEGHKRRMQRGEFFPPFFYVSIINSCNLRCQGCWVDVAAKMEAMSPETFHQMVKEARAMGNVFFGIVGGEPFMHPQFFDLLEPHPDCYFQIFTNGQFITDEKAKQLRKLGNVTPLISVEGNEIISDERRGRNGVLSKTLQGVHNSIKNKLFTGVCTSLCQTNFDLLSEKWIDRLIDMGVMYTWFHVYRPMGPDANPQLCLTPEQQLQARKFVVEMRAKKPIIIIDAYFDGEGQALCPAANGLSHHINPWGDIEPCPIVQFTRENALSSSLLALRGCNESSATTKSQEPRAKTTDNRSLRDKFVHSEFLRDFRTLAQTTTRGCIVLERPDLLRQLVLKHEARDSTVRQTALAELEAMTPRTSQYNPVNAVPEKNLLYRLAKRFWFNDFGVYNGHDHSRTSAAFIRGPRPLTETGAAQTGSGSA
jgi:MoaA/NifB/PqqE/SkfB family radical SAM enzyme